MLEQDARLERAYKAAQRGDTTVNQLIGDAAYLVQPIVEARLRAMPSAVYLRDDLHSAGLLALTEACQELPHDLRNVAAYLTVAIRRGVNEAMASEECLSSPRTQRRNPDREKLKPESLDIEAADRLAAPNNHAAELLDEIINGCCSDNLDRQIITLRHHGHTDAETAALVDRSETTVRERRQKIEARFLERNEEYALSA